MHDVCDLLEFKFCNKTQYQNFPIDRVHIHKPAIKSAPLFRFGRLFFRRFLKWIQTQRVHQATLTPFLPVLRDAFIVGDAVQPGLKFRFTFKIFQPVQHFKHHLLTDIVSIAIVPQISCTHVKKRSLVTAHQFFIGPRHIEKLDVGPRDQLLIRELAGIVTRQKRLRFIQNKSCRQSVQCPPRPVSATWRHRLAG
ncbi:Asp-tRNAAsn/Glu-tRNAGln amidotransferase A subunit or related amidase [Pseudomonas syringae pv. actinidiae]|uniref:Asp-tRNAAsn/Glu-tRNAGln amidotransferase A subunit or related amidase n=1 Tax=Pseudomonas syringae pv. actinidiae TaxID=103796 RepID=A0AAN4TMF3_PSESF|nr:Asp-tRNAAsn/Glu-tRNAGln amidotransferase A subunit or related amidase [Pseudomonas syringae pv. actinidiae]